MTKVTEDQVLDAVAEMDDAKDDADKYDSIPGVNHYVAISEKAVLINTAKGEHWFPFSHLRKIDDDLFASQWIMEQKGLI